MRRWVRAQRQHEANLAQAKFAFAHYIPIMMAAI